MEQIKVSEMVAALSYALDLTEGQPMGHSARSCVLGMRIAAEIGMSVADRADLYYALLIKDAGCSSNASRLFHIIAGDEIRAKRDVKTTDWTKVGFESLQYAVSHVAVGKPFVERVATLARVAANRVSDSGELVKIRCERGASVARRMGFSEQVAAGIHSLDEQWNGGGYPDHLRGRDIPLFSRIALLAQTLEVFWREMGADRAVKVARERAGRWFDPDLATAVESLAEREALWPGLDSSTLLEDVWALEPVEMRLMLTEARMDEICLAFAEVVDAKSPFTYRHSTGVADAAVAIARTLGMDTNEITLIRRAALLHDIGKLSVPNSILEKPAKLDAHEWDVVKKHPHYSHEILRRIPGFGQLSEIAASHHERLDGKGYFRSYDAERLDVPSRILAVADVYDALAAKRPYRDALPPEMVMGIMKKDAPHALDAECLEALAASSSRSLAQLAQEIGTKEVSASVPVCYSAVTL
ncbi:MAG: HD domain-containing phosphohydrolase [Bryobacteraceae bacterium]